MPFDLMEAAILGCVGLAPATVAGHGFAPLMPGLVGREFALIDLGVLSPHFEAGNWEQPGIDQRLLQEAAAVHGLAASRYGQYRLSRTRPDSFDEPETFRCMSNCVCRWVQPSKLRSRAPYVRAWTVNCVCTAAIPTCGCGAPKRCCSQAPPCSSTR